MAIRHVLFDLDGTLLPMDQTEFVKFYMPLLAKAYVKRGIPVDAKAFIKSVWDGYLLMVKNDGRCSNRERFWTEMEGSLPISKEEAEEIALDFYRKDFNQAAAVTRPTPLADQVVKTVKEKGMEVYLATNPVFPRCATLNRIHWAGLHAEDFRVITTYEDYAYCKPSVEYFQEILEQFALDPKECLMVGNDVEEDLSIRRLGVKTFLLTDTKKKKKGLEIHTEYQGSMEELLKFVEELTA